MHLRARMAPAVLATMALVAAGLNDTLLERARQHR